VLAGIGKVESDHGRHGGAALGEDGRVTPLILGPMLDGSGAGGNETPMPVGQWAGEWGLGTEWQQALGPMQFLPGTFASWAVDGDSDGTLDPHDIDDAVFTAAAYLCGSGGKVTDERSVLHRYNDSDSYVDLVLGWAARYAAAAAAPLVIASPQAIDAVLGHPNLVIYEGGRDDIASGRVDPRVLQLLISIADQHPISVTSLVSGHPRCAVTGQVDGPECAVSNHYFGRAADIGSIDGMPVSARNAAAIDLMRQLSALPADIRPDEIGGPVDTGGAGVFTNAFHSDHVHFGYDS
jgi:hypothetical protein